MFDESCKQYRACLPWVNGPIQTTNKHRALAAAARFAKKYMNNTEKYEEMTTCVQSMLDNNFIELVPDEDLAKTSGFHYIVAFPVWRENSDTHKCRMVYQANQIMPETKKSLNDHLLTGKNNLPEIPQLLIRFRAHEIAGLCDVSKMFNRFLLDENDKEYLRFFFALKRPKSKDEKVELLSFRKRVLPFGLTSCPYMATYLLQKHASKFLNGPFHKAAEFVMKCCYIDDCQFGADSPSEMEQLVKDIKHIFDECSLPTHKYSSNCSEALKILPDNLCSNDRNVSVLGLKWDTLTDSLSFNDFAPPTSLKLLD